jgi:hypothetical protein
MYLYLKFNGSGESRKILGRVAVFLGGGKWGIGETRGTWEMWRKINN